MALTCEVVHVHPSVVLRCARAFAELCFPHDSHGKFPSLASRFTYRETNLLPTCQQMRFTLIMRNAPKAADPWKTHTGDTSPLWKRVREALVVNPDSTSGACSTSS